MMCSYSAYRYLRLPLQISLDRTLLWPVVKLNLVDHFIILRTQSWDLVCHKSFLLTLSTWRASKLAVCSTCSRYLPRMSMRI